VLAMIQLADGYSLVLGQLVHVAAMPPLRVHWDGHRGVGIVPIIV
jgi:hypothetical protein